MADTVIPIKAGRLSIGILSHIGDSSGNVFVDSSGNIISSIVPGGSPLHVDEEIVIRAGQRSRIGQPSHVNEIEPVQACSISRTGSPLHIDESILIAAAKRVLKGQNYEFWVGGYPNAIDNITPYLRLYTPEYQGYNTSFDSATDQCPNRLLAFSKIFLQKVDDIQACAEQITQAFDLDQAAGVQLDIIGERVGASRVLPFQPSNNISPVLNDADFLILIKATIAQNMWDGRIDSIAPIWNILFPAGKIIVTDCQTIDQTMTIRISVTGNFSGVMIDMIQQGMIVPRPEGVLINFENLGYPWFGFDANNTHIAGFDKGRWAGIQVGY